MGVINLSEWWEANLKEAKKSPYYWLCRYELIISEWFYRIIKRGHDGR